MMETVCVTVQMASVGLAVKVSSVMGRGKSAQKFNIRICIVHTYVIGTIAILV